MKFNKKQTFIVTGGAGFIGINLCKILLENGVKVIIIDDFSSGLEENIPYDKNLLLIHKKVQDINFNKFLNISGVFHLAAQASVPFSIDNFFESSSNNNLSALKIIEFCYKRDIPLVYASSSAVYGNLEIGSENGPLDILHPYSLDKYAMELYAKLANRLYGLRSCGLRFFNVYGPYQDGSNPYSGVISIFIDNLLKNAPIVINGGNQKRDFIFVDDVVKALLMSFEYLLKNKTSDIFNVLSNKVISIKQIATLVAKILNIKPTINYKQLDKTDPIMSNGCSDHILQKLGFVAEIDIEEGVKLTIDWAKFKIGK